VISVITPTIREGGLELVSRALRRQTVEFEWLIGSPFNPKIEGAKWVEDDFGGGFWSLNRIYNKLIKAASGDLIVSWQDFTSATPQALEKFLFHFNNEPKTLVTGVGNKYTDTNWVAKVWQDPRERVDQGSFYQCDFSDIEWNFCAVPKQAIYDVGGFDERLDFLGFGMDGYSVNERIFDLGGYDFKIDQSNKSFSTTHDRIGGWENNNLIHGGYVQRKRELIDNGTWPVLNFLQGVSEKEHPHLN